MIRVLSPRWLPVWLACILAGCGQPQSGEQTVVSDVRVSAAEWQAVAEKKVLFGHQSVGQNILDGVQSLAGAANVELNIAKAREPSLAPGIQHFPVGRNEDPEAKIADFAETMNRFGSNPPDVALFKFCYLDIGPDTDAAKLAAQYSAQLDSLALRFPGTTFIAVTAPVTERQTGPKAWVKRILGRSPSGYLDNARRKEFNEKLRATYAPQGRLFDLAAIETEGTDPLQFEGRSIEVLNPAFTDDGGHLNDEGRRIVAARFIKFLAALPDRDL